MGGKLHLVNTKGHKILSVNAEKIFPIDVHPDLAAKMEGGMIYEEGTVFTIQNVPSGGRSIKSLEGIPCDYERHFIPTAMPITPLESQEDLWRKALAETGLSNGPEFESHVQYLSQTFKISRR